MRGDAFDGGVEVVDIDARAIERVSSTQQDPPHPNPLPEERGLPTARLRPRSLPRETVS